MKLFNIPIVRHLVAGCVIVGLLWFFSISPLQQQNKRLQEDLKDITAKQHKLISELSFRDTYKIENRVDAKIKKGGEIKMIPDNDLQVVQDSVRKEPDSLRVEKRSLWQRIFRKKKK